MNSEDHFKKLTEKLGIEFRPEKSEAVDAEVMVKQSDGSYQSVLPTVVSQQSNALTVQQPPQSPDRVADEETDYTKVRTNYDGLAQVGQQALNDLLAIARITNEPRAFEVIATLIKSLNETNKNLYGIHEESKKTKELQRMASNPGQTTGGVSIDKAVFVGSATDLLEKVRNNDISANPTNKSE